MKLYEVINKGPGDYWAGDELNPESPDFDPVAYRKKFHPQARPSQRSSRLSDKDQEGLESERRQKATQSAYNQFKTDGELSSGEYKGKPYNLVMTITGPSKGIQWKVNSFLEGERNIYHDIAGVDIKPLGDDTAVANVYILASKNSLLRRHYERKYKEEQGTDYAGGHEFANEPKPLRW